MFTFQNYMMMDKQLQPIVYWNYSLTFHASI